MSKFFLRIELAGRLHAVSPFVFISHEEKPFEKLAEELAEILESSPIKKI